MFFSMSLAPSYLEATATVATVARAVGDLDALVAIFQMTVSQMDGLSMSESHHQRLHWLSEQVLNWSGLPVIHVRSTGCERGGQGRREVGIGGRMSRVGVGSGGEAGVGRDDAEGKA